MGTYAPNYTARYGVRYRCAGREHVAKFRYGLSTAAPTAEFIAAIGAFFDVLKPLLVRDFAYLGAFYIPMNANISLPAPVPPTSVPNSEFDFTKGDSPRFMSFVGRSITGQPAAIYVYGVSSDPGANNDLIAADNRILASESATVAAAIAALEVVPLLTETSGSDVLWQEYANLAYSAYYQRKNRRS